MLFIILIKFRPDQEDGHFVLLAAFTVLTNQYTSADHCVRSPTGFHPPPKAVRGQAPRTKPPWTLQSGIPY